MTGDFGTLASIYLSHALVAWGSCEVCCRCCQVAGKHGGESGGGGILRLEGCAGNEALRAEAITVLDPDLSMFTQAGGGPRCLSMSLLREAV